ncbi:AAA family ATPase [Paenibacillus cymbidii]|uniref:AAA family ATPase n=1 Tax=Paenibacillus cymbidii TaxID=1639034 RepID=UPI0010817A3F|nr:AAA family ATPase [Paenibacillus cymbidii]
MELIYAHIGKFRNFRNQSLSFTNRYLIDFDHRTGFLEIEERRNRFNLFQHEDKLTGLSVIVGKNGAGKSNILDLLHQSIYRESENQSYFLLYHLRDNLFLAEGVNTSLFKAKFSEYPFQNNTFTVRIEIRNKLPVSIIPIDSDDQDDETGVLAETKKTVILQYKRELDFNNRFLQPARKERNLMELDKWDNPINLFNRSRLSGGVSNQFRAMHQFFRELGQTEYFGADARPEVMLHLSEITQTEAERTFVAPSIQAIDKKTKRKLSIKQQFILQMLYLLNVCYAFEFIDNTEEDWEKVLVEEYTNIPVDKSGDVFGDYTRYYLKLYRKLVEQIVILLRSYPDSRSDHDDLKRYFVDSDFGTIFGDYLEFIYGSLNAIPDYFFHSECEMYLFSKSSKTIEQDRDGHGHIASLCAILDQFEATPCLWMGNLSIQVKNLSEGEKKIIDFISRFYWVNEDRQYSGIILLLDEPDQSLHPEWSRRFLHDLLKLLHSLEWLEHYQIILTTHSPFMLSDVSKEHIIALESGEGGISRVVDLRNPTFANHIHTILSQDFFMSSTVGEYAKQKVNETIAFLNHNNPEVSEEKIAYHANLIQLIGDDLLKSKLETIMSRKKWTKQANPRQTIEQQIRDLQELLNMLKDEDSRHDSNQ